MQLFVKRRASRFILPGGSISNQSHCPNPLVMSIFDDKFLSRYYWQEPTDKRASRSKKT